MNKRLNFVFFEYFNIVGKSLTWDSLTRRHTEWLKIVFLIKNILFPKNNILRLLLFFNSENNIIFLKKKKIKN